MGMESQAKPAHPVRRGRQGLGAAAATAVVLGALLVAPSAAAQAVGADPWVSEVPNNPVSDVYRFTVPRAAVTEATGLGDGPVAVQGNYGPGKAWTDLNMGASGTDLTATLGPLEPGLYYYQYAARPAVNQDAVAFRNPDAPQEVTSCHSAPGPGTNMVL